MSPTLEVLVEEPSAKSALDLLLPRICPDVAFTVHPHQGKPALLKKLPGRLEGYAHWPAAAEVLVVVLLDRDTDDCLELKGRLEAMAARAGLATPRTASEGRKPVALTRIAVEELEAWFFGDVEALRAAYPRLPATLTTRARYRAPDDIRGGTAEALERELQRVGYHTAGMSKVSNAALVAEHMNVEASSSPSFIAFRDGIRRLITEASAG